MLGLLVVLVLDAFMNLFIDHHGKNLGLESFHAFLPTIPIFGSEHLWGHHKRVATDLDPASSNVGDNVYTFWVRCIIRSFVSALDIESRYLKNKNLSIFSHRILRGYLASGLIAALIYNNFVYWRQNSTCCKEL